MSGPIQPGRSEDPQERRLRRSWWLFVGSFVVLGLLVAARFGAQRTALDAVFAAQIAIVGAAAIVHRNAVHALEVGRRAEVESLARILQGLSRSVSPDAIVDAIVEELGAAAAADHVVVVRRRPESNVLEARLVSSRPGVPTSTTLFPASDLEERSANTAPGRTPVAVPVGESAAIVATGRAAASDATVAPGVRDLLAATPARVRAGIERLGQPGGATPAARAAASRTSAVAATTSGPGERIAERLADRARDVYGLRNTLAAPLQTDHGVVGAIVLSRRVSEPWPPAAHRLLAGAATEASAALARATHHRDAEARATTDALTQLPNRRYFDEFCGLLARRRRSDDAVGVLLVDIDRFKAVNDTFGHAAGDAVLRAVAGAIVAAVREEDVPARFGGEEFAVLLRNPSREVAVEVAERVRHSVAALDLHRIGPPAVTVSVGVAVARGANQPIDDLVAAADRALYEAKRAGRDRVVAAA